MRKQFRDTILELAKEDESIVLLFGDVSVYLFNEFKGKYPERFYNLGICENTIIATGAGLSAQGFTPFLHTITPFITERSYEHIKLDLCYNQFPANIVTCGASFDYAWDGATHHCYTDLAILRLIPDIEVLQPGSRKELDVLLRSQYNNGKTTYYRLSDYPHEIDLPVEFGRAVVLKDVGAPVTVMTSGPILKNVMEAIQGLKVNLVYFHTIKPLDAATVERFKNTDIVVVQDAFGLHDAVCDLEGVSATQFGLGDIFCRCYGTVDDVRREIGLDVAGIRYFLEQRLEHRP